ncbi:MAG TPA: zinc-ribbon domain containing protein [Planctomycetota bacterium]|nr:zinc-ribbon domain containing protein [Planctomycetota bacterium]
MTYVDKQLTCKDCGESFVFSAGQQQHHAQLGLRNEPKRCPVCRQMNRMRNEDRGRRPRPPRALRAAAGAPGNAGPPGVPARSFGPRETFQAVCAQCGRPCDLPFKPRGDRPVYCRSCFRGKR